MGGQIARSNGRILNWVFRALLTGMVMSILSVGARAQGGPPMITDDTETVPTGHFEINTAFTIERGADGELYGTPLVDLNYGLSEHFQLKVEIPWLVLHARGARSVNGIGNTNIGIRWRFRDEHKGHRVAMSIYPQFEFNNPGPSVRRGLVEKGPEFLIPLQVQTQVGKYGVNADVGYRFRRGEDEMIYGAVLGRTFFKEKLELLGELHGSGGRSHLADSEIVYNFGTRVGLTKHTAFLLSAGRSIRSHYDPTFIGYAGIQVNF